MGETNTTEPKKPSFAETIEPLARRYNELIAEDRQRITEKREGLNRETLETYSQMINETSKAILEAAKGERKPIIQTAIDAFAQSSDEISVAQYKKQDFIRDVLLKTVELAESRTPQTPQK